MYQAVPMILYYYVQMKRKGCAHRTDHHPDCPAGFHAPHDLRKAWLCHNYQYPKQRRTNERIDIPVAPFSTGNEGTADYALTKRPVRAESLVIGRMGDEECASAEDERLSPRTVKLAYVHCCRGMGARPLLFPSTAEFRGSESRFIGP
jgi:hypothetical protein